MNNFLYLQKLNIHLWCRVVWGSTELTRSLLHVIDKYLFILNYSQHQRVNHTAISTICLAEAEVGSGSAFSSFRSASLPLCKYTVSSLLLTVAVHLVELSHGVAPKH